MNARLQPARNRVSAFTLLEVMIAIAIFFMAVFAILDLVMQSIRAAHSLNQMGPTAGMVAAELSMTNKLEVGGESGDFGELYPDYSWAREVSMWGTNGMFQVDILVMKGDAEDSSMSILLYRPESEQRVGATAGEKKFSGSRAQPQGGRR